MPPLSDSVLYWVTAICLLGAILRLPPQLRLRGGIVAVFLLLILESPRDPHTGRMTGPGEGLTVFTAIAVLTAFLGRAWRR